jgi:hypothetical protein
MYAKPANLGRFGVAILAVLAVAAGLSGGAYTQYRASLKSAWLSRNALLAARSELARAQKGAPDDWSHRHLVFSNPGSEEQALRGGRFEKWMRITNDPRFILQQKKRSSRSQTLASRDTTLAAGPAKPWGPPIPRPRPVPNPSPISRFGFMKRIHRDWGFGVSTGNPSPVSYPAKWSFDTTSASCANDFVVYPTGADAAGAQASIVAYFNLYSGCGGTVPSVDWAYDTGGVVTGAPSFSYDGSQMAFIQTTAGVASLVLLRLPSAPPGTGTLTSPITLPALSPTAYATCAAPCITTIALSGNPSDTFSNPWIEYASDTLYVGDDAGKLHQFAPVFSGTAATPAAEVLTGFPVKLGASLGSPVFDTGTGEVFVGSSSGVFYAVGAGVPGYPSIVAGQIYGTSATLGASTEEIVDAPIVDSAAGMAYVFVQEDADGDNAVFQFPTTFTSGSGTEEAAGTFGNSAEFFLSGTFDNLYFTSEDSCGDSGCTPTGNLYVGGNTVGPATLYQIPITANVMGTANVGPALETTTAGPLAARTSPVTEFFNASGGAATGAISIVGDPATWTSGGPRSVTFGGVTYTFVTGTPAGSTATDVQVNLVSTGTDEENEEDTAANLEAAINADAAECNTPGCFGAGTVANASATATVAGITVDLTATSGGAAGDFTITESGGGINVSGGDNGTSLDFIFFSTYAFTGVPGCPTGCVLSFDVSSGATITAFTAPRAVLDVDADAGDSANGFVTGGFIVDNDQMTGALPGTSQVYFLTLDSAGDACGTSGSGICAVQASQAGLK